MSTIAIGLNTTFTFTTVAMVAAFELTASRLTRAFARGNATPLSKYISSIDSTPRVLLNALVLGVSVVFIIGCIYLASSTALNALVGTGMVLENISFAFPQHFPFTEREKVIIYWQILVSV